ncbi:MAG: dimethyl sulfoxide reductase anchor subunit family protein [Acidobacteriota bacterium]
MTEGPLIGFTLLAQMAVGVSLVLSALNFSASAAVILLELCIVMGIALALSFFHLGTWANAWRAIRNLRSSWLSREILFSLLFMGALIFSTGLLGLGESPMTVLKAVGWGTAILGLALVYSMTRVYRLRTVPTWNTWSTTALFFTTTLILGTLGYATLILSNANSGQLQAQIQQVSAIAGMLLTTQILIVRLLNRTASSGFILPRLRLLLLSLSLVAVALVAWDGNRLSTGAVIAFILAFAAEVIGRYTFYQSNRGWPYGI